MKRFLAILLLILILLTGCSAANLPQQSNDTPTPTRLPQQPTGTLAPTNLPQLPTGTLAPPSSRITLDLLKNFSYWVEDFKIQAAHQDGVFSDGSIRSQLIEPAAFGDLNGDGLVDAAVILAIKSGGTGTFYDLIAVLDQNGTPVQAGFSYIGDRQKINHLEIVNGRIVVDYLTQGPTGPLCCPSEHRLRSYLLEKGVLRLASEQVLDNLASQATPLPNAILIDQPNEAMPLTSPQQVRGRVSQVSPEKKLVYHVTGSNGDLLLQGEVVLEGKPGGPGSFAFEFNLNGSSPGLIQVEVVDSSDGILRGRTILVLVVP